MAKPARSSQRKSSDSFSYLSYFCFIHFFSKDHTHTALCQERLLFLLACSFKTPDCTYYCFRTTILHREALSEEKYHNFSSARERCKPPVLVPLPAFPPCDFSLSPQFRQGCFRKSTPPLHSSASCKQLWLQLLQKAMTLQVSSSCPCSLSTSQSRGDTQADSWCSCCSYQPVMATGWHRSEERRSTQKGLPSCAIDTALPGKNQGVSVFWEPQRIFLHLPTGGAIGQTLDWTIFIPPSPPTAGSVQKTCVQLSKANFKAA